MKSTKPTNEQENRSSATPAPAAWRVRTTTPEDDPDNLKYKLAMAEADRATLQASHASLEAAIQALGDSLITTDLYGRITRMNRAAERLVGVSEADARGRRFEAVFRTLNEDGSDAGISVQLEQGPPSRELEEFTVLVGPDGATRPVRQTATSIRDRLGQIVGLVHVFREQTHGRVGLRALIEARTRYHAAFDLSPVGAFIALPDGTIREANPKLCQMLGYHGREIAQLGVHDLVHPDDEPALTAAVSDMSAGKTDSFADHLRCVTRAGRPVPMRITLRLRRDAQGRPKQLLGHLDEVVDDLPPTEEFQLPDDIRTQRWFETAKSALLVVDRTTGLVIDANPASLDLLCCARNEIVAVPAWEIAPLGLFVPTAAALASLEDSGFLPDLGMMTRDGRRIHVEIEWDGYVVADAAVVTFRLRDVTERFQAAQVRNHLEAQSRLDEKMEALAAFGGSTAHKLNNLLSVILGYNEFALTRLRPGDPLLTDLEQVQRTADRAAELTGQLLAFGRTQPGQPEMLDLSATVLDIERTLQRILGEDRLLLLALGPVGPTLASRAHIEQVLVALAQNASDAMRPGGALTVSTSAAELDGEEALFLGIPEGRYVVLAAKDTGAGMDAATRSRMFEPHFTTRPGAAGLGLSKVYGIVRQASGHLRVDSEPGQGTTITVYFPRVLTDEAPSQRASIVPSAAGGTETVLLVEDDDAVRAMTRRMIGGAGYAVLSASSGAEALLLAERHAGTIHLVVTDLVMPYMSGEVFVSRLAEIRPDARVLYMSGYTPQSARRDGAPRFIGKPFQAAELTATIRHVLDHD